VRSSGAFLLPFSLTDALPHLEPRGQLLVGGEWWRHPADKAPDLLGELALPCLQERIDRSVPPRNHLAAGFEELRLSRIWLESSGTQFLGDALNAIPQMSRVPP
jgi:hypothetical protein